MTTTTEYQMPPVPPAPQVAEELFDRYRRELSFDAVPEVLPAVLARADGRPVLYAGKFNTIVGTPGTGKSWIALLAVKAALAEGARVAWIDHEEHSNVTMSERCRVLGIQPAFDEDSPFYYTGSEFATEKHAVKAVMSWLVEGGGVPLVVIDAAFSGGCPSDGSEVTNWYQTNVTPWQRIGCTVILIDHVAKRSGERLEGGLGSQAKLAIIDGVCLAAEGYAWTRDKNGRVQLKIHKDRPGAIGATGDYAAAVKGTHRQMAGVPYLDIQVVEPRDDQPDTAAPSMEKRLIKAIADAASSEIRGLGKLRATVTGANSEIDAALKGLIDAGMVEKVKVGQTNVYRLVALPELAPAS